jgi:hypothetical protein
LPAEGLNKLEQLLNRDAEQFRDEPPYAGVGSFEPGTTYVGVREAAERLGLDRSRVLKFIKETRDGQPRLRATWQDLPLNGPQFGRPNHGYWLIAVDDLEAFARIPRKPGTPGRPGMSDSDSDSEG